MIVLNIQTTTPQTLTCAQAEAFVKAHLGLRTSVSEPASVNTNPPFPLEGTDNHLPTAIQMTDGIYSDTRAKLLSAMPEGSTINGTEYQRVLDEEVRKVLASDMYGSEDAKIVKSDFEALTTVGTLLQNNENVQYVDDIFKGNAITNFTGNVLRGCSNLKQVILGSNITACSRYNAPFSGCTNMKTFAALGMTFIGFATSMYYIDSSNGLKNIFLPKVATLGDLLTSYHVIEIVDVGKSITKMGAGTAYKPIWGASWVNLVIRATDIPTFTALGTCTNIFVPNSLLSTYQSTEGWSAYTFYPISGTKWAELFGSTDEYADIDKYVTDPAEREEIKQAYRNA